ncbi:MAG TPA: EamA family transporter [Jatrophihabitantaceae bacterium]|nr:EamA family transporter [Jatrophihabitantaceae bacterium]
MVVVFALLAAVIYGTGDFVGAFASRHRSAITVLLYAYPVGALLMLALLPAFAGPLDARTALLGVGGGIGGMVGVIVMYSLMARAPMNIISPVTAVLAAVVPVGFGLLVGERPHLSAWLGIAIGLIAVMFVSYTSDDHPHGPIGIRILALACLSGVGFGVYFICLARANHDSGLWPLVISRLTSAALIVPLARGRRVAQPLSGRVLFLAVLAGVLDASANLFFLLASRHGLLSVASVITSLYPAMTVLLAVLVLHEHTGRLQRIGLAMAATSIVLISY